MHYGTQPLLDLLAILNVTGDVKSTGSVEGLWLISHLDKRNCSFRYKMIASDSFRFGSATREKSGGNGLGDNPFGKNAAFNTIYLEWRWEETIYLNKNN